MIGLALFVALLFTTICAADSERTPPRPVATASPTAEPRAAIRPTASTRSFPSLIVETDKVRNGLTGHYYDDDSLKRLTAIRTDLVIDNDWGSGPPFAGIDASTFSARWTGRVKADHSETYTFFITSDDGARLWIGDKLLIDDWYDHSLQESSGTTELQAGLWYPLRLEYYQNKGNSHISLRYSSPNTPKQVVPADHLARYDAGLDRTFEYPRPTTGRTLNVQDYGATPGDSKDDDGESFKRAIERASDGDEVYAPNGVYHFKSAHVELKRGVSLRGESRSGTVFRAVLDEKYSGYYEGYLVGVRNASDVSISDFTIDSDGGESLMYGVLTKDDAERVDIRNLVIEGFTGRRRDRTVAARTGPKQRRP
ncbi:MAG: PA14 domain-containing protein [Chloroflexia bacterium]